MMVGTLGFWLTCGVLFFFGLLRLVRLDYYLMMGMIGRVFGRIWVGIPF